MRYIEQACRQGQNPFEKLTKEKFQERKKVIQLHEAVLNVIRYICQCRAKEVDKLQQTETKKRRNIEKYDEDIIELAANLREVHSVIADKWIDNTKTELQKTHKLMELIVDVENGVISSSREIPTIQNLATATSTATLCTESSVSRATSVTTLGEKKSSNEKMKMKYNFRNTGSLSNLTRPNSEHEKKEQKAFQVFNDKGHLTRQLGMLLMKRSI